MFLSLRNTALVVALVTAPFNLVQCIQDAPSTEQAVEQQTTEKSKKQKDLLAFETRLTTIFGSCIGVGLIALGIKKVIYGDTIQYTIRNPFGKIREIIDLKEVMSKLKDADSSIKFSFLQLLYLNTRSHIVTRTEPATLSGIWHIAVGAAMIKLMKFLSSADETRAASEKLVSQEPKSTAEENT